MHSFTSWLTNRISIEIRPKQTSIYKHGAMMLSCCFYSLQIKRNLTNKLTTLTHNYLNFFLSLKNWFCIGSVSEISCGLRNGNLILDNKSVFFLKTYFNEVIFWKTVFTGLIHYTCTKIKTKGIRNPLCVN